MLCDFLIETEAQCPVHIQRRLFHANAEPPIAAHAKIFFEGIFPVALTLCRFEKAHSTHPGMVCGYENICPIHGLPVWFCDGDNQFHLSERGRVRKGRERNRCRRSGWRWRWDCSGRSRRRRSLPTCDEDAETEQEGQIQSTHFQKLKNARRYCVTVIGTCMPAS